jgi:transcriptional regulator with XRE-family HTH domain
MGRMRVLKAKRLTQAMELCTGAPETVADKLRFARLSSGVLQEDLAAEIGIDRATLLRYENGQVAEENMRVEALIKAAIICGRDKYFCCSPYHIFLAEDAGRQIKQYRKRAGLTQKQLAAACGVALNTVKRWESNEHKPPLSVWELVTSM